MIDAADDDEDDDDDDVKNSNCVKSRCVDKFLGNTFSFPAKRNHPKDTQ